MRKGSLLALLSALVVSGCASVPKPAPRVSTTSGEVEIGLASYYSDALEGGRTASGEPYRGRAATCAHRTHPFGTRLEIEVIESGARAICRVNDRGPFIRGRVIDVSKHVAGELELLERGLLRVRVRPVLR